MQNGGHIQRQDNGADFAYSLQSFYFYRSQVTSFRKFLHEYVRDNNKHRTDTYHISRLAAIVVRITSYNVHFSLSKSAICFGLNAEC